MHIAESHEETFPPAWDGFPLYGEFLTRSGTLAGWFPGPFSDDGVLADHAARGAARLGTEARRRLASALREYNRSLGAGPVALAAIDALEKGAPVISTGQQPGLLTGPLFTVYKAVTVVAAARHAQAVLGRPVVPLFWIVSDDHDWAEINHIHVLGDRGDVRRLTVADADAEGRPFGLVSVSDEALRLAAKVVEEAGTGGDLRHAASVGRFLAESGRASRSVSEWFGRIMARLFHDEGLVMLDPMRQAFQEASADVLRDAAVSAPAVVGALARGAREIEMLGYSPSLPPNDHALLFLLRKGLRVGLLWSGEAFVSRRDDLRLSPEELVSAALDPGRLSPGAPLRAILRDRLLPTLAHVAGPGEVSYLAQLRPLYRELGVDMPIIMPRLSLTLVAPEVGAWLTAKGIEPSVLKGTVEDRVSTELERAGGRAIAEAFSTAGADLARAHGGLVASVAEAGVDLSDLADGNRERIEFQLGYLEEKARHRHRQNHRGLIEEYRRMGNTLFPLGRSQERILNVVPWLLRVGWGLASELLRVEITGRHRFLWWREGTD